MLGAGIGHNGGPRLIQPGDEIIWAPQPGPQAMLVACPVFEIMYGGARGGGKCLPLTEPVLTPFGWQPLEAIGIGSQVCNPDGSVSRVIDIHRPGRAPCYDLTFSDGARIRCDDGHLWLGEFVGGRIKRKIERKLWRFSEIRKRYEKNKDARFLIPLTEPVKFTRPHSTVRGNMLPVDPYLLGVLLGDGSLTGSSIRYSTQDDEIDRHMAQFGDLRIDEGPNRRIVNCRQLIQDLKWLGVWGKRAEAKSIPEAYQWAAEETRWAVLQGLMDTDGTADSRGQCYYSSASAAMAVQVQFLARSLGFKATLTVKPTTHLPAHCVYIRGPQRENLFRLSRKRVRAAQRQQPQHSVRRLVSIACVGEMEVGCFKVDNPNGLFVARDFIVTHNTDGMIGDWLIHAAEYGRNANGLMVRRTMEALVETIERAKELLLPLGAKYHIQGKAFKMPNGARLKMRYLERDEDAQNYQGHSYTRVYVEELTQFPDPAPVMKLMATLRSAHGVPVGFRATANPGGPGHLWVKRRYIDPCQAGGKIIRRRDARTGLWMERIFIPAKVNDNKILLDNDPLYIPRLAQSGSETLVKAWLDGDWSVIEGAYFDCFSSVRHVVRPHPIPKHWTKIRSFDWGSASPFSVHWWAISDGLPVECNDRPIQEWPQYPKNALIAYREWYGANGDNKGIKVSNFEIGKGIRDRTPRGEESQISFTVCDPSIFKQDGGPSIAEQMWQGGRLMLKKGDNQRIPGWGQMRSRMLGDEAGEWAGRAMIFFFNTCTHAIRTIPVLQHDDINAEDLDTDGEDHAADDVRYACQCRPYIRKLASGPANLPYGHIPTLAEVIAHEQRAPGKRDVDRRI